MKQRREKKVRKTYYCILLVLDCLDGDLGQEIIVEHVRRQMRLDGQAFGQELLVEVFPRLLTHEDTATAVVLKWSARAAHHLQNVHHGVVDVAVLLALVVLHAHDDDHVAGDGKAPRCVLGSDEDLNSAMLEQPFHNALVLLVEGFVVVADPVLQLCFNVSFNPASVCSR